MIYYRDKYCKLFEDNSNENDNLDNTNNSSNNNIQSNTINITSRDIKNNFQDLLKLSKDKQNSVISIAKQRFENKLDNNEEIQKEHDENKDNDGTEENNLGIPSKSDIEKASVAVQDVENK